MSASSPREPLRIRLDDNPAAQAVQVGEALTVEAAESPATGYLWDLESEPRDGIQILDTSFVEGDGAVGAAGTRTWILRAVKGPRVKVVASLRRPWERGAAPERSAAIVLVVRE